MSHAARVILLLAVALTATVAGCSGGDGAPESAQGVYVFDLGTGALDMITNEQAYELSWTADGGSIWYATNFLPGGAGEIVSVDVASRRRARIVDMDDGGFASIAAPAGVAAWVAPALTVETYVDGRRASLGDGIGVDVSRDGSRVLYLTPPCASSQSFVVSQPDGSAPDDRIARAFNATWLADGRIAYNRPEPDPAEGSTFQIYDPDTGTSSPAADALGVEPGGAYVLSPDASFVLYGGDVNRIMLRDIGGGSDVDVGAGRARLTGWSPDSMYIAYAASDILHIAGRDGADRYALDLAQLSDAAAEPIAIAWSPDGGKLAIGSAGLPAGTVCPDVATPDAGE